MFSTVYSPNGVNTLGGLLSESLAILNGAHLSPASRLAGILRRYHVLSSSEPEFKANVSKSILKELRVTGLTTPQWQSLVNGVMAHPVTAHEVLAPFTRGSYRSYIHLNRRLIKKGLPLARRYSTVSYLEDRANVETDNPRVQAEYLQAVLYNDPQYVIRRFESGRYAMDSEVRAVYLQAVELAKSPSRSSFSSGPGNSDVGSKNNPLHVVSRPPKMEFWRKLLAIAQLVIIGVILASMFSGNIMATVKSGVQGSPKEFRPDSSEKEYTFEDVQGIEEAKAEVMEVVEFLREPEKFQRLGAKLPTGLLLIGPPGTGKTLLAKAIAGEADVPFFFVSGSEFDEMFVGVGAARMRKLFEQARMHKPCVVFIDELDAVGGARLASSIHPYSRMTLNQLLVEMDGYKELEGVVIIGATNFPESLDKALIRPGRFDSQIHIPLPDVKARFKILKTHSKKVTMAEEVDLEVLARGTSGFTGADLANLINQAALHGSANGAPAVSNADLEFAKDKIIMGAERKSAVVSDQNRKLVAYHESGHAIVALFTPGARTVHKATIIPRGSALGMVVQLPEEDELNWSKTQLLAMMDVSMGGRVAEEIVFGSSNITTGASSDLEGATKIAKSMVMKMGMTDAIGLVSHDDKASPATQKLIEDEVKRLLKESYARASSLLQTHAVEHRRLAEALLKYETLTTEEIQLVIKGKSLNRRL